MESMVAVEIATHSGDQTRIASCRLGPAVLAVVLATMLLALPAPQLLADEPLSDAERLWVVQAEAPDARQGPRIQFYFFWSKRCPHCRAALPEVRSLGEDYPWLDVHSFELSENAEHRLRYLEMAEAVGRDASSVPGFLFCGQMIVGFDELGATTGEIRSQLGACYRNVRQGRSATVTPVAGAVSAVRIPLIGEVDVQALSLPALTVVLAALDSINPCAFFVLLFLLSLLVHVQRRGYMLLVGGLFVLFSGLIYFLFMAAWLNLFMWVGQLRWITAAAGMLAVVLGLVNVKDFFWFKKGVSLSIPDGAKPHLFSRMRMLVQGDRLATIMVSTVLLAIAANSYELLCTAGFPMIYTRVLTINQLPAGNYYFYLAMYNMVYVVPLLFIVGVFAWTLGARKLGEREGRVLKLISGLMMLELGLVLLVAPGLLNNVLVAAALLVAALLIKLAKIEIRSRMSRKYLSVVDVGIT
ncbi:MAG: hypothetical protein JSW10_07310 [Pseudomonadota bacterium]|nr:MAG: hypothetical protein JSW10_07310 [Pseudomonadota bacterium]